MNAGITLLRFEMARALSVFVPMRFSSEKAGSLKGWLYTTAAAISIPFIECGGLNSINIYFPAAGMLCLLGGASSSTRVKLRLALGLHK